MRKTLGRALGLGAVATTLAFTGATPPKPKGTPSPSKLEETVGELSEFEGVNLPVQGIGLVVGLDGTGYNPPPTAERQKLLDEMRKARVDEAEKFLDSRTTALVIVKARIPAGATKTDPLDVEVEIPAAGASTETSLVGGQLILTRLYEVGLAKGEQLQGQFLATAGGSVITGTEANPADNNAGHVLGGGRSKNDVPYVMLLKDGRKSARTAKQIEGVIQRRFHHREGVEEKGAAVAKTDHSLVLKIPHVYHQNQPRFFQVLKLLPMVDNVPEVQADRMKRWAAELLDPESAGVAALRLEGAGKAAFPHLKPALTAPDARSRFFAAEALAYLDDPSGVDVLAETSKNEPKFRAHALAALSAMDHPAATLRLRQLLNEADPQVRYGAFNALRALDERDPYLGQVRLLRPDPEPEEDDDPTAMSLDGITRRRRPPPPKPEPFALYLVDCEGPPLVHVSRTRRCEVVVFGRTQKLLTPMVLGGSSSILLNAAEGDESIQVSRVGSSGPDAPPIKVACTLALGDAITTVAQLGANYPDVLELLRAADRQKNLAGPLVVDSVPVPSPAYLQNQLLSLEKKAKKDDAVGRARFEILRPISSFRERLRGRNEEAIQDLGDKSSPATRKAKADD